MLLAWSKEASLKEILVEKQLIERQLTERYFPRLSFSHVYMILCIVQLFFKRGAGSAINFGDTLYTH